MTVITAKVCNNKLEDIISWNIILTPWRDCFKIKSVWRNWVIGIFSEFSENFFLKKLLINTFIYFCFFKLFCMRQHLYSLPFKKTIKRLFNTLYSFLIIFILEHSSEHSWQQYTKGTIEKIGSLFIVRKQI